MAAAAEVKPGARIFNFGAGPATMPVEVLEKARRELVNWHDAGMSVMEMSHRGKEFVKIATEAEAAGELTARAERLDRAGIAVLHVASGQIHDAEGGDRRLGGSHAGKRGQRSQGEQGFFHFDYLLG